MVLKASLLLLSLSAPATVLMAQTSSVPPTSSPSRPPLASATLQPSLDILRQALSQMAIDKWKASPAIRDEADSNLRSVQHDLQSTLPTLLTTADAEPASAAKALPVYRNVEALYDVMLRLDAAGRLAAPAGQISALDQALASLSDVRHTLGDQVQMDAEAQEARATHLQTALNAVPPLPAASAPVPCTPTPPVRKKRVTKPASKPTTPATTTPATTPAH
jgi:hypothetical protein